MVQCGGEPGREEASTEPIDGQVTAVGSWSSVLLDLAGNSIEHASRSSPIPEVRKLGYLSAFTYGLSFIMEGCS